jgi:hypothetical protein
LVLAVLVLFPLGLVETEQHHLYSATQQRVVVVVVEAIAHLPVMVERVVLVVVVVVQVAVRARLVRAQLLRATLVAQAQP